MELDQLNNASGCSSLQSSLDLENNVADLEENVDHYSNETAHGIMSMLHDESLSGAGKKLLHMLEETKSRMSRLDEFDAAEVIKDHCERLIQNVNDAVESAKIHLDKVAKNLCDQIDQFRESCLKKCPSNQPASAATASKDEGAKKTNQDLRNLTKEFNEFKAKWIQYEAFVDRLSVFSSEESIQAVYTQVERYNSKTRSLEKRMKSVALDGQVLEFVVNAKQLQPDCIGEIINTSITDKPIFYLNCNGTSKEPLFLRNGRLAICSQNQVRIWNFEAKQELFGFRFYNDLGHFPEFVTSIVVLLDGRLASGSSRGIIRIWNLERNATVQTIKAHNRAIHSLRLLSNGNLVSFSEYSVIKVWDLVKRKPVITIKKIENEYFYRFIACGVLSNNHLVTLSSNQFIESNSILRVWDSEDGKPVGSFHTDLKCAQSMLVLSNDEIALGFRTGAIKVIDLAQRGLSTRIREGAHAGPVLAMAQLSNSVLISSGKHDSATYTIKMWNLRDLQLLHTIRTGHREPINSLSVSRDEKLLVSGSYDNTIKVWPIESFLFLV